MRRTLEMTVIEGIKTTVPMHLRILAEADFAAGRLSTHFMDRYTPKTKPGGSLAETA
jgi:acetyl-CoA carboxylase biotin carboxylase subunit